MTAIQDFQKQNTQQNLVNMHDGFDQLCLRRILKSPYNRHVINIAVRALNAPRLVVIGDEQLHHLVIACSVRWERNVMMADNYIAVYSTA